MGILVNTKRSADAGLMLAHRLRRWSNIGPTLGERLVFYGNVISLGVMKWGGEPFTCQIRI